MKRERLWLWVQMVFTPASKRIWSMSANYDDIEEFAQAVKNHEVSEITESEYERADSISFEDAEKILNECSEKGIKYYSYESEGYPVQLKEIANPPAMLFFKGNLDFLNDKCIITVVGTRKPSEYSLSVADRICGDLIDRNIILVTGFAEGIDQYVNNVSINKNSFPVAVCGTALDYDYPKGSTELKNLIADKGVIISEYYPGCKVTSGSFSSRNRISVGLSKGVLFIEAARDSHGLDNYSHALYQGKAVFVVPPHDIYDKRYYGQRDLIRNECQPVFGAEDIIYALADGKTYDIGAVKSLGEFNLPAEDSVFFKENWDKKPAKRRKSKTQTVKADEETVSAVKIEYDSLDEVKARICRLLENKNMLADDIASEIGMEISDVLAELTELEMFGYIKSLPGKMFGL